MHVTVTQADIDLADQLHLEFAKREGVIGNYAQSASCPISCAVKREYPQYKQVTTNKYDIALRNGEVIRYQLPHSAQRFINAWDADVEFGRYTIHSDSVEPFDFELM